MQALRTFTRKLKMERLQQDMHLSFKRRMEMMTDRVGPLIGDQNELIQDWWRQMAS